MKLILVVIFSFISHYLLSQTIIIEHNEGKPIPYAHVQIFNKTSHYIFSANQDGAVSISYTPRTKKDSIKVTAIGYQMKVVLASRAIKNKQIRLNASSVEIDEITITAKKSQSYKLGNLKKRSFLSSSLSFEAQKGIYIPIKNKKGIIKSVRIYMQDIFDKEFKFRPFKLRLYEGNEFNPAKKEITPTEIIIHLEPKGGNWVEINLSQYQISLPKEGILVAIQAMSAEYYIKNKWIESKYSKKNVVNSISIGLSSKNKITEGTKAYKKYKQWNYWSDEVWNDNCYMIQLIIEK